MGYNEDISFSMISEAGSVEAMMRSPPGFPSFVHSPAAALDHTKVSASECLLSLNPFQYFCLFARQKMVSGKELLVV